MDEQNETNQPEEIKNTILKLERKKLRLDVQIKEKELELAKKKVAVPPRWLNSTVMVGILSVIVTLVGSWLVWLNGQQELSLQRQQLRSDIVLELINARDTEQVYRNLDFFLDANLIQAETPTDSLRIRLDERDIRLEATASFYLGDVLYNQRKLDEAVAIYDKVIELDPENPQGYVRKGISLRRQGLITAAIEAHNIAITKSPTYTLAYQALGDAYTSAGNLARAIDNYQIALGLDPATRLKSWAGMCAAACLLTEDDNVYETPCEELKMTKGHDRTKRDALALYHIRTNQFSPAISHLDAALRSYKADFRDGHIYTQEIDLREELITRLKQEKNPLTDELLVQRLLAE